MEPRMHLHDKGTDRLLRDMGIKPEGTPELPRFDTIREAAAYMTTMPEDGVWTVRHEGFGIGTPLERSWQVFSLNGTPALIVHSVGTMPDTRRQALALLGPGGDFTREVKP